MLFCLPDTKIMTAENNFPSKVEVSFLEKRDMLSLFFDEKHEQEKPQR